MDHQSEVLGYVIIVALYLYILAVHLPGFPGPLRKPFEPIMT